MRSYWNSGLRRKPSCLVHRQSCQSWYSFPPPSIFSLLSLQLSRNNSIRNAYYVGYRISKRSNPGGRYLLKKICYQEAPPCRKGTHCDCFLLTIGIVLSLCLKPNGPSSVICIYELQILFFVIIFHNQLLNVKVWR